MAPIPKKIPRLLKLPTGVLAKEVNILKDKKSAPKIILEITKTARKREETRKDKYA